MPKMKNEKLLQKQGFTLEGFPREKTDMVEIRL